MVTISPELRLEALRKQIEKKVFNRYLYKYKPDNEYTRKVITENSLWFAQPSSLNDLHECKANSQYEKIDFERWFEIYARPVWNNYGFNEADKEYAMKLIDVKSVINRILDNIGILSLAQSPANELMWAHYADDSQGVCFEFDILKDSCVFSSAKLVNYVETMPVYNHFVEPGKIVTDVIATKFRNWDYEEEVRIIKSPDEIKNNGSRAFIFNPSALTKVIFGPRISDEIVSEYKTLCKGRPELQHVKFVKMVTSDTSYSMIEQEI